MQAGFENLTVSDSSNHVQSNSLDLLTIADYRPQKPVADFEKGLEIATASVDTNPYNLNKEQLNVLKYGVQSALTADVDGLKYFAAYMKNSPEMVGMANTFTRSLNEIGIHSSVTMPPKGDISVNFGAIRQDKYGVAEIAKISSSGDVTALDQVLPPAEPNGQHRPENNTPRQAEDVLRSVAENGLLSKQLRKN